MKKTVDYLILAFVALLIAGSILFTITFYPQAKYPNNRLPSGETVRMNDYPDQQTWYDQGGQND